MAFKRIKQHLRHRKLRRNGVSPATHARLEHYGSRSGVWALCPSVLNPKPLVYSFGVGDNIAWDLAMISEHGAEVHAFDPTPRSKDWIASQDSLPASFHYHPYGLAHFDGDLELFEPKTESKFNYSTSGARASTSGTIKCPVRRLSTIASELRHDYIDVLKMDIEGSEVTAIDDCLAAEVSFGQLLVEFHYNYPEISFESTVRQIETIRRHGFELLHISERAYEFSFARTSLLTAVSNRTEKLAD